MSWTGLWTDFTLQAAKYKVSIRSNWAHVGVQKLTALSCRHVIGVKPEEYKEPREKKKGHLNEDAKKIKNNWRYD